MKQTTIEIGGKHFPKKTKDEVANALNSLLRKKARCYVTTGDGNGKADAPNDTSEGYLHYEKGEWFLVPRLGGITQYPLDPSRIVSLWQFQTKAAPRRIYRHPKFAPLFDWATAEVEGVPGRAAIRAKNRDTGNVIDALVFGTESQAIRALRHRRTYEY